MHRAEVFEQKLKYFDKHVHFLHVSTVDLVQRDRQKGQIAPHQKLQMISMKRQ